MDTVEDWRLVVVLTEHGFQTYVLMDDGVLLLEDVEVE